MSRLGFKSVVYHGDSYLGELDAQPVKDQNFQFPNNEIRIHHLSPASERCPPLSVLQTISPFSVRCKLESLSPIEQPQLINLHASCFHDLQTAVVLIGDEELHLVAMPSKLKKFPCFWCYAVPSGLYAPCLGMLNLRCLAIVFDLDETLIVANTMKSFEDRIELLRGWMARETDSVRVSGMTAELKRYTDDRALLKQYAESDYILDNGKMFKVQFEEVLPLSDSQEKIVRPVIRLPEKNIVLTRINPEIRDTSVLVRLRPAWEDLRSYLTAKGRKRFEVYVCTMAERDYALEMWRLLDPEAHLISAKQLLDRVICVKSGARKSLFSVFQDGNCLPKMAMVIDDRLKVWEDRDQPRVHVVPAFAPYYAPQAETAHPVPVLCVARNVACNVRGGFFKEFDESLLRRISEQFFEDEVVNLPSAPDVSNYLISEDYTFLQNGNTNAPIAEGMNGPEVAQRLNQPDDKIVAADSFCHPMTNNPELRSEASKLPMSNVPTFFTPPSFRTLVPSEKPSLLGAPFRRDGAFSESDPESKRRFLIVNPSQDKRYTVSGEPHLPSRLPTQLPITPAQPQGGWLVEEDNNRGHLTNRNPVQESDALKTDKQRTCETPSHLGTASSTSAGLLSHVSEVKGKEGYPGREIQRQNPSAVGISGNLSEQVKTLNLDIVEKAGSFISMELAYVYELVIGVIDVNRSKDKGYETLVKDGFCDELDELRQIYEELPEFLEEVLSLELDRLPSLSGEKFLPSIVYIHQIGYLMCFFGEKLTETTLASLQDFEFVFSDEDGDTKKYFYRTSKTRELDSLLGDMYHKILDMERAITRDLVSRILLFAAHLLKAVSFAAELDCLLSLALVARQNNYVRPILSMENLLEIRNGRHVLQEITVDTFIPNDTKIDHDGRVNIITGPNYSGKSIYIKQVALIVFLSHIGSFVPADAATVGLTDRIFCAMGSKLMMAEQSTFMIDLHQVGIMLRHATPRSLCLLDEFGKGTLTEDGVGLLGGTINHFANCSDPPKVLVCTHLTEIFYDSCLLESEKIKYYTMSVLRPDDNTDVEEIVFLYRLVPGHALLSYGLHCALLAGVPEEVIKRAAFVLDAIGTNKHIERVHNEKISAQDQQYQDAVDKMLNFDALKGDLNLFFQDIFPH